MKQVASPSARLGALAARRRFGVALGLERVRRMLRALGDPLHGVPVVHIAGTNGKGSTAAMVASVLRQAGYRSGLYSSPHLCCLAERIAIDGVPIGDAQLDAVLDRVLALDAAATFFEVVTAAGFLHFAEQRVDVAIIETGLGGRLDATNVVEPSVTVITPIALDHAAVLGSTLPAIAAEKAGIVKRGVPLVAARAEPAVTAVLDEMAAGLAAPVVLEGRDFQWSSSSSSSSSPDGALAWHFDQRDDLELPAARIEAALVGLSGVHQRQNAALALAAVHVLGAAGVPSPRSAWGAGLAQVVWPGRLERIGRFILDCAHNAAAARALVAALPESPAPILLAGMLADKDARALLGTLKAKIGRAIFTCPSSERALDPEMLCRIWGGGEVAATPRAALELIGVAYPPTREGKEVPVIVTGSVYLVGEVRALLTGEPRAVRDLGDPAAEPSS